MQLSPDGPYTSIGTQRGDPEDHEPIDRKRMARLSSQMSRSHHPVEKAMAPVPVRDARQSFPMEWTPPPGGIAMCQDGTER